MSQQSSRRWCFTLNNYSPEEYAALLLVSCVYAVFGKEVGESATPHVQGFFVFDKPVKLGGCKKISSRAHWEPARGTSLQASDYCKKDGEYEEIGVCPLPAGDAEKVRWKEARAAAKRGALDDVPDDIYIKYYRTLKEIAKDHMPDVPEADDVTGVWLYGEAGAGKSRKARDDYPGAYLKMQNKWWDGYQNEDYVILDDFDSKELGHHLKIWADRYPFVAETKGGAIKIRPKKFIITSNYSPDHFEWDEEMRNAIKRRFKIVHVLGNWWNSARLGPPPKYVEPFL